MDEPWVALIGTIGAALLTYLGVRATARSNQEAKRIESTGPAWKEFTDALQARMDAQDDEIEGLKDKVDALQRTVDEVKRKYWQAISGLRRISRHHPDAIATAELSPEVKDDLDNY